MATPVIDKDNPWPWLDPFTEKAKAFFNGREDDSAALERCVVSGTATVLFSKSGLGKTSLLQAGLFPRLRKAGLLPVLVRLVHGGDSPPAAAQIRTRLHQESTAHGLAIPGDSQLAPTLEAPEDRLWLDLHTSPIGLHDEHGGNWQPVFVLDQFEEIFTLGGQDAARQQRDFGVLGDLIENRIPSALESAIGADEDLLDVLQLDAQAYRVILSLREDYLPNLERWCDRIPRLGPNRYRLLPMQEDQALKAIRLTGGELVTPEDAQRIVRFVANQQEGPALGLASGECVEVSIEPALLSLLCSGLNLERQTAGASRLDASDLEQRGGRIMERFYDDATSGVAAAAVAFVEDELITPDGVRLFYPLKSILQNPGISKMDIDTLIERRLLRRQPFVEGERIEVVHDRLATVARQRRKSRESVAEQQRLLDNAHREAETKEANVRAELEKKARESESKARQRAESDAAQLRLLQQRLKRRLAGLVALLCLTIVLAVYAKKQAEDSTRAEEKATILQLIAEGQALQTGQQHGGTMLGMLRMLAAYRIAVEHFPEASPAALSALQTEYLRRSRLMRLIENDQAIESLAISPDGSNIVSGSSEGVLRLWNALNGTPVGERHTGHTMEVLGLAFSPNDGGQRIVSASRDGTLRLWDTATLTPSGEPIRNRNDAPIFSVAFSPNGMFIGSGDKNKTVRLWDAATRKPHGEPLKGDGDIYSIAFSPDSKHIAAGASNGYIRLWDVATRSPIGEPLKEIKEVRSIAFSPPNGDRIVSGNQDMTLRLWNTATGTQIGDTLRGHSDVVNSVAFSPDGSYIVSGSRDATLRLWDVSSCIPIAEEIRGHSGAINSVAISASGEFFVSGSQDKSLIIWNPKKSSQVMTDSFQNPGMVEIYSVAFSPISPKGDRIVSGSKDGTLRLWDTETGNPIGRPLEGHDDTVQIAAFSPDGKRIVSGSADKTLRLWDAETGNPISRPLEGHDDIVYSAAFSPDGKRIVSGSADKSLRFWDAETGKPIGRPLEGHEDIVYSTAFSPDGKRIVSGSADKTLRLWDSETGKPIGQPLTGHSRSVSSVAFSPDGRRIVSGSNDMTLLLWDAATGKRTLEALRGHTDFINAVAFSRDGRYLVSGSRDTTLRLWDATTGSPVGGPLYGHTDSVYSVAFSPDGKHVASGSEDRSVRRWPVLEAWAEALCAKLPRNMSPAEWRQLIPAKFTYIKQCPSLPVPEK